AEWTAPGRRRERRPRRIHGEAAWPVRWPGADSEERGRGRRRERRISRPRCPTAFPLSPSLEPTRFAPWLVNPRRILRFRLFARPLPSAFPIRDRGRCEEAAA